MQATDVATTNRSSQALLACVCVLGIAAALAALLLLLGVRSWDAWGGVVCAPVVFAVSIRPLRRQAEREDDASLLPLLMGALALKLVASVVRHYVAFTVYGGVADASGYDKWGTEIASRFLHGNFTTGLPNLSDTNFIRFLTGIIYSIVGPSQLAGFLLFSWIGFWGLFLFYRAFTIAVPEGRTRSYARLVFFLPSLLFWPSGIGKEAWMMFSLGLVAFGAAKMLVNGWWRGVVWLGLGLWLAAIVRPHVAGMAGIAVAAGYVFRRPKASLRQLAPIVKTLSLTVLIAVAAVLVARTDAYLKQTGVGGGSNTVSSFLAGVADRTSEGGSQFAPSVLESPARTPVAVVTVLFRPLLIDATSVQSLIAAFEGTFLLFLALIRYRWILSAVGSLRRQPYVAMALAYIAVFIFGFSAIANFGLLARERVQLLPFFLVFLAVPPREIGDRPDVPRY